MFAHRIMGIVNEDDYQIVFSDTPGMLETHYKLHESMMKFVESAFVDADLFILVTEVAEKFENTKYWGQFFEANPRMGV